MSVDRRAPSPAATRATRSAPASARGRRGAALAGDGVAHKAVAPAAPKGQHTRALIVDKAMLIAERVGLEGLSIGALAEATGMSKSGVFAHFGSRDELQLAVVRHYHARFEEEVFRPALAAPRGLPRLQALFDHWLRRVAVELDAGCIYISGAVEFDDRPGVVRDALAGMVSLWHDAIERAFLMAVDEGHLPPSTDPSQCAFETLGVILAVHHDARFLRRAGSIERARMAFARILEHPALPKGAAAPPAA